MEENKTAMERIREERELREAPKVIPVEEIKKTNKEFKK